MECDSLITWVELSAKVRANAQLDPVEQFIYDEEPAGNFAIAWRKKLQAALYFIESAPQKTNEKPPIESKPCCKATLALVIDHKLGSVRRCPICGDPI